LRFLGALTFVFFRKSNTAGGSALPVWGGMLFFVQPPGLGGRMNLRRRAVTKLHEKRGVNQIIFGLI
jgi:hypothetical protein